MNQANSSGLLTASAQVSTLAGRIYGLQVTGDATNAGLAIVYDSENSTVSGKTVLCKVRVTAGAPSNEIVFNEGVILNRGIYVALTGTGCEAIAYYSLG